MEYKTETTPPNPWPDYVAFITTGSALPAGAIAFQALLRQSRRKLPVYGLLWTALTTVARRDICAHCPYYGEYCSTLFGKITALMWPRSDKPLARQGFYWDLILLPAIFVYPVSVQCEDRVSWKVSFRLSSTDQKVANVGVCDQIGHHLLDSQVLGFAGTNYGGAFHIYVACQSYHRHA